MGVFQTIQQFLDDHHVRYAELSQPQAEAFVDALTFAMIVDGEIAGVEEQRLADALEEFEWRGEHPLPVFVDSALDRAENCKDMPDLASDYCSDIADRLDDPKLEREVYYLSAQVACADEVILDAERELLQHFVEAFELDREQLQTMTRKLRQSI
ncbi:MAG: hypothetical protein ABEN55_05165 [Bradymonadaceae bacterium]